MPPRPTRLLLVAAVVVASAVSVWRRDREPAATAPAEVAPASLPDPERPPNFLIIDIDTLTADRVGSLRDGVSITPVIDGLASRGARFSEAFSQAGWTLPAVSSVLTGSLPVALNMEDGGVSWRGAGVRDLPEILGLYGYTTIAFWGNTLPGPLSDVMFGTFGSVSYRKTKQEWPTTELIRWLATSPKEPFFAMVHEIDLHDPSAMGEIAYPYDTPDSRAPTPSYERLFHNLAARVGEDQAREVVYARYEGVLHVYDAALGRVLAELQRDGRDARTVVVVTSNHGEDFFDHAIVDHGLLYDTTLRVPLVVMDPATPTPGRVVDTLVQSVDLAPTVLARAGIPADRTMDGRSMMSLLGHDAVAYEERPLFSLSERCHVSLRHGGRKLILRPAKDPPQRRWWKPAGGENAVRIPLTDFVARFGPADAPLPTCPATGAGENAGDPLVELYDLTVDPGERKNLALERPEEASRMLRSLLVLLQERAEAAQAAPSSRIVPEAEQKIREQGYWGMMNPGAGDDGTPER